MKKTEILYFFGSSKNLIKGEGKARIGDLKRQFVAIFLCFILVGLLHYSTALMPQAMDLARIPFGGVERLRTALLGLLSLSSAQLPPGFERVFDPANYKGLPEFLRPESGIQAVFSNFFLFNLLFSVWAACFGYLLLLMALLPLLSYCVTIKLILPPVLAVAKLFKLAVVLVWGRFVSDAAFLLDPIVRSFGWLVSYVVETFGPYVYTRPQLFRGWVATELFFCKLALSRSGLPVLESFVETYLNGYLLVPLFDLYEFTYLLLYSLFLLVAKPLIVVWGFFQVLGELLIYQPLHHLAAVFKSLSFPFLHLSYYPRLEKFWEYNIYNGFWYNYYGYVHPYARRFVRALTRIYHVLTSPPYEHLYPNGVLYEFYQHLLHSRKVASKFGVGGAPMHARAAYELFCQLLQGLFWLGYYLAFFLRLGLEFTLPSLFSCLGAALGPAVELASSLLGWVSYALIWSVKSAYNLLLLELNFPAIRLVLWDYLAAPGYPLYNGFWMLALDKLPRAVLDFFRMLILPQNSLGYSALASLTFEPTTYCTWRTANYLSVAYFKANLGQLASLSAWKFQNLGSFYFGYLSLALESFVQAAKGCYSGFVAYLDMRQILALLFLLPFWVTSTVWAAMFQAPYLLLTLVAGVVDPLFLLLAINVDDPLLSALRILQTPFLWPTAVLGSWISALCPDFPPRFIWQCVFIFGGLFLAAYAASLLRLLCRTVRWFRLGALLLETRKLSPSVEFLRTMDEKLHHVEIAERIRAAGLDKSLEIALWRQPYQRMRRFYRDWYEGGHSHFVSRLWRAWPEVHSLDPEIWDEAGQFYRFRLSLPFVDRRLLLFFSRSRGFYQFMDYVKHIRFTLMRPLFLFHTLHSQTRLGSAFSWQLTLRAYESGMRIRPFYQRLREVFKVGGLDSGDFTIVKHHKPGRFRYLLSLVATLLRPPLLRIYGLRRGGAYSRYGRFWLGIYYFLNMFLWLGFYLFVLVPRAIFKVGFRVLRLAFDQIFK